MHGYNGRRVVIAGAGRGAGRALAVLASQAGATVVLGARTPERLERSVELVARATGRRPQGIVVDFGHRGPTERFFRRAERALGGLDTVFNLTGGWFDGALHEQDERRIDDAIQTILRPMLLVNQVAPRHLDRHRHPAIVNFGAVTGGLVSTRRQTLYNTMKGAVSELTRSLAADLVPLGIRVNAVLPGAISHEYHFGREWRSRRRLGRWPGTPEDVAHAALFLGSPEASWITGACLPVDGGFHVHRANA